MATPTCIKCGGHIFETKEVSPKHSNFRLNFVQCGSCGGVVGVLDFYNIGAELQAIKKLLKAI
jgi:hypothetical protein